MSASTWGARSSTSGAAVAAGWQAVAVAGYGGAAGVDVGGLYEDECAADCPLQLRACPAGSRTGGAGEDTNRGLQQCSGRGVCLIASGACECFNGYTGDACDACAPGFWRSTAAASGDGACVRQYVRGMTLPQWDLLGASSRQPPEKGLLQHPVALPMLVIGSALVALVLVALGVWLWRSGALAAMWRSKRVAAADVASPARVKPHPASPARHTPPSGARDHLPRNGHTRAVQAATGYSSHSSHSSRRSRTIRRHRHCCRPSRSVVVDTAAVRRRLI
eukprot:XP_001690578.1 predicted protein [Chlamydomonas reinhardtii]